MKIGRSLIIIFGGCLALLINRLAYAQEINQNYTGNEIICNEIDPFFDGSDLKFEGKYDKISKIKETKYKKNIL